MTKYRIGTLFGVLINGLIQAIIMFDGTLNSWWTKIAVGLLTVFFIVMQRALSSLRDRPGLGISVPGVSGKDDSALESQSAEAKVTCFLPKVTDSVLLDPSTRLPTLFGSLLDLIAERFPYNM